MTTRRFRWHRRLLTVTAGGLLFASSCGLSDYQLATVWQSVLTAGLDTLVTGALTAALGGNTTGTQTQTGTGTGTT